MGPYKIIGSLVLAIMVAIGATLGVQQILGWRQGAQLAESQGRMIQSASDIQKRGDSSSQARDEANVGVATGRETFNTSVEESSKHEPETASRDVQSIPDSRLRAFQERRQSRERYARDRLGRAGVKRQEGSGSEAPAER